MRIAIYGRQFEIAFLPYIRDMFNNFHRAKVEYAVHEQFMESLSGYPELKIHPACIFGEEEELADEYDFLFSIGGDGTFLEAVSYVWHKSIPLIGINSGRLGFLANISGPEIPIALDALFNGRISLEERSLLELKSQVPLPLEKKYALNEITIQKKASSMITIHTYVNDEFLNAYWADGLIISTPTGSTAYSMSAGGPILVPECSNFIISPIAPHNLTVRPLVIRDDSALKIRVSGRDNHFLLSADYQSVEIPVDHTFQIEKAGFSIKMVRFNNQNFYNTLRNKLMWGVDKRN